MSDEEEFVDLIPLHRDDNVACLPYSVSEGARLRFGDSVYDVDRSLGLGFKIAIRPISLGEKVYKFGAAIGSASVEIAAGDMVHVHNMKSDYIPTYTLEEGSKYGS